MRRATTDLGMLLEAKLKNITEKINNAIAHGHKVIAVFCCSFIYNKNNDSNNNDDC